MCFFKGTGDLGAQARAEEDARQERIKKGKKLIMGALSGFDDKFYADREASYVDYATPQLDDQLDDARKNLTFTLARNGKQRNAAKIGIADRAKAIANQARENVERTRGELYSQLTASANPAAASNLALSRAGVLGSDPSYSPLGNIFQNVTAGLASANQGLQDRNTQRTIDGLFINPTAGGGSSRVVG